MNLSRFAPSLLVVALFAGVSPSTSRGQPTNGPGTNIPQAVADMASGDRDRVVAGRRAIIDGLTGRPNPQALAQYAAEVAGAIKPVVEGNDPHAKLNAAIAVQRIADQSGSIALAPPIVTLIRDASPAISTYGLRASANVLPRLLANAAEEQNVKLVDAIVGAVTTNPSNESVATEAYAAMTRALADRDAANLLGAQIVNLSTPRVVDGLNRLVEARMTNSAPGTLAEPSADLAGVNFLSRQGNWALMGEEQRVQSITSLVRVVRRTAQELVAIEARRTPGPDRERMLAAKALNRAAIQGLSVYATLLNNADLKKTTSLGTALTNGSPTSEYDRISGVVVGDFSQVFPNIKSALGATTAPAAP